jgi:hypothetical protein
MLLMDKNSDITVGVDGWIYEEVRASCASNVHDVVAEVSNLQMLVFVGLKTDPANSVM